jgi:hypothetical protein
LRVEAVSFTETCRLRCRARARCQTPSMTCRHTGGELNTLQTFQTRGTWLWDVHASQEVPGLRTDRVQDPLRLQRHIGKVQGVANVI